MNKAYDLMKGFIPVQSMLKCRENGAFLIISNHQGEICYLNSVAQDIWNLFDGKRSIESVLESMLEEYDVQRDILENDLINFIRDMQWKEVVQLRFPDGEKLHPVS